MKNQDKTKKQLVGRLERDVLLDTTIIAMMDMTSEQVTQYLSERGSEFSTELSTHITEFSSRHPEYSKFLNEFGRTYLGA